MDPLPSTPLSSDMMTVIEQEYLPAAFYHPMHNDILMTIYQFSIDLDLLYPFDYQWSIDGLVLPPIDGHLSIFFLT